MNNSTEELKNSNDLIERQAVLALPRNRIRNMRGEIVEETINVAYVEQLPSVQPEVVKCEKCRYLYYDKEFDNYWCDRMSNPFKVEANGYCKWGK